MSVSRELLPQVRPSSLPTVVKVERITYMALVSRCPLVAEDVMSGTEHHHVREVVAKAQEPGVRTDFPRIY